MSNRLAGQSSPYLLQHAENPIDWHPWDDEALQKARREDKPIFLSIGYSACHWCHVMAHESFEDPAVAEFLNRHFISIKVDREEHPEIDQIYMEAVQMLVGNGGWPLSVFLSADLQPFFGGTYWPREPRGPVPGFLQVIEAVYDAWLNRRGEVVDQARRLTAVLQESAAARFPGESRLLPDLLELAQRSMSRAFDPQYGGFGRAPKFPHPMDLRLLLRHWRRDRSPRTIEMVRTTLDRMAAGGIYDHLGGGFHRYSTDERWLVPHFEKMLYDNALLAACYTEAWQATGEARYAQVVRETLDYVLRDMTDPAGGFHSTEDADSQGHEGLFYLWTRQEVQDALGDRAERFCRVYDVTDTGNFEGNGQNILNLSKTIEQAAALLQCDAPSLAADLAADRQTLFERRGRRVRPAKDDKVLVGWNGLMIDALALAGAALAEPRYVEAAGRAADFLLASLRRDDGGLWHAWRRGQAAVPAFLEDYAALAEGLVTLYEATFEERWIDEALRLSDYILAHFADPDGGGFYMAEAAHANVLVRKKDLFDNATPSGGGLAAHLFLRLGRLAARDDLRNYAEKTLQATVPLMRQAPLGCGQLLLALEMFLGPTPEIVLLGDDAQATITAIRALHRGFLPNRVLAFRPAAGDRYRSPALDTAFSNKQPSSPGPTLFVCQNFACQAPVSGLQAVLEAIERLSE